MANTDNHSPDEPAHRAEEEAQEGALLATDWLRIALVATIGLLLLALFLLFATGRL